MLKTLMLRRKIDVKKADFEKLRAKDADFEKREADLEAAIAEATTEEEQQAVDAEIEAFGTEKKAHDEEKDALDAEIKQLESDLEAEEAEQRKVKEAAQAKRRAETPAENKGALTMIKRIREMSIQERDAFMAREDVKEFLTNLRAIAEKRAVTGGALTIPEIMLPMIRSEVERYSKLMKHVLVRPVSGDARQPIMGDIPEGVWTEMCANINEADLNITQIEIDGYKVATFIPICNALLADNDVSLAAEIVDAMAQGLAYALDKAIAYGTGATGHMPTGIIPSLPAANKVALGAVTDKAFFKALIEKAGLLKHGAGELFFAMNNTTKMKVLGFSLDVNAAGAIVAMGNTMPVLGGAIETLDFIPDNLILFGYGRRYLLGQRAGILVDRSEHVRFTQDETVFRARARYDGKPVFADAFALVGIGTTAPSTALPDGKGFKPDEANA